MKFDEMNSVKGFLEIYRVYKDGKEELAYSENNVITSGMGLTLAHAFAADQAADVSSFQANWMQVGTGASSTAIKDNPTVQVSSRADCLSSLPMDKYGDANTIGLVVSAMTYHTSAGTTIPTTPGADGGQAFAKVPPAFVHRVSDRKVMWRLILNDSAANQEHSTVHGGALNEVAIFANNPTQSQPPVLYMIAYRAFSNITKTSDFTLDFRWTIEF